VAVRTHGRRVGCVRLLQQRRRRACSARRGSFEAEDAEVVRGLRVDYDIPRHRVNWLSFSAPAAFDESRPGKPGMDHDIL
jgi:hypothetical protein